LGLAGLFTAGFAMNEWSHGGMTEMMGLGHHHMSDVGGYHCAMHDDAEHVTHHMSHMHGNNRTAPHDACPGGGTMHGPGGMSGGMMHG
jgi:hypothetical protein